MGTALILGGAGGIGRATTEAALRQSWTRSVVAADNNAEALRRLAEGLPDPGKAFATHECDLRDDESFARMVESYPDIDFLAITVGVSQEQQAVTTRAEFDRVIGINLVSVFLAAQAYAVRMMERGGGSIVVVSSITAFVPRRHIPAYCASKAGLTIALRSLALEASGSGVRINIVSPGHVDTEQARLQAVKHGYGERVKGDLDQFRMRVPSGRTATAEDVAQAIVYLLGPDSSHVVMHDLVVDGGETMGA